MTETMRAVATDKDGTEFIEIPKPSPGRGEVLIKVIASAVNAAEEKILSGSFVGRFLHSKTSPLILGWDFAGIVAALGEGVNDISKGDTVWGHLAYSSSQKQGAYAEYITVAREEFAVKPEKVPFQIAAASATVSMTSLQSIRDLGRFNEGDRVMIIGAAGGIGSVSIGIGKRLGGHVTAVCSTRNIELVEALGADVVIDRKKSDPLETKPAYKVVFDTPAVYSFGRCTHILESGGAYVTTLPNTALVTGMGRALFSSKRCYFVQVASRRADLELVGDWLSDGLEIPIDSRYKIADLGAALERQTDRDRIGRVVVDVADGWPS